MREKKKIRENDIEKEKREREKGTERARKRNYSVPKIRSFSTFFSMQGQELDSLQCFI